MIPVPKGQKAVRACTIRLLNLGHAKYERNLWRAASFLSVQQKNGKPWFPRFPGFSNRGWENRTLYFYPLKMGKSLDLQGFPAFRNLIPLIPFDTPGYQILKTNRFIQLFEFCWFALIAVIIIVFRDRDIRVSHKPSLFCQIENERKANLSSWNLEMLRVREERKKQGYTNSPELNIIDTDSSITDCDLTL